MGIFDLLFGTNTKRTKIDETDSRTWENYQYGEKPTIKQVKETFHAARENARSDPRSKDPNDISYTGDWGKPNSSK